MNSAFDGEAPETDDEIDEPTSSERVPVERDAEKIKVPVDKALKKKWSHVATESINICQKRTREAERTMQKVTESAADCFSAMQNVASKLNQIHSNVTRLEDSVADLADAAKLFPSEFPSFEFEIPTFY